MVSLQRRDEERVLSYRWLVLKDSERKLAFTASTDHAIRRFENIPEDNGAMLTPRTEPLIDWEIYEAPLGDFIDRI